MAEMKTDILIVGGGPGGVSTAVTAARYWPGKRIMIVRRLLMTVFDEDICVQVEEHLEQLGIHIHVGSEVETILSDASGKRAAGVRLKSGEEIAADAVLIAIGVRPQQLPSGMTMSSAIRGVCWILSSVWHCEYGRRHCHMRQLKTSEVSDGASAGIMTWAIWLICRRDRSLKLPRFWECPLHTLRKVVT